jgi:hypothetical protein
VPTAPKCEVRCGRADDRSRRRSSRAGLVRGRRRCDDERRLVKELIDGMLLKHDAKRGPQRLADKAHAVICP